MKTLEATFKGMLENGVPLTDILTALHNSCVHGERLTANFGEQDCYLTQLFEGYDICLEAARKIEQ